MKTHRHLIIGGGIAGTTIAVHLFCRNEDFLLLEASNRLGGKVETKLTKEGCFELGPSSFADQPSDILDLICLLDLGSSLLSPAPAAQNRYILKKGKIVRLPFKPPEIFTTQALSFSGKLRFLREFLYVPSPKKTEESVADFFYRHFGREAADYFAAPFVAGITAGDAVKLSLKEAFPSMAEAEAKSRSLLRHLIFNRKTAKATPQSLQLKGGLESLFHRAWNKLGDGKIHLEEGVEAIKMEPDSCRVTTATGEYVAEKVYLTIPAFAAAPLMEEEFPSLARQLSQIDYAPVMVAHLRVSRMEDFPFDGFGILIPPVEGRKILGVLWNSSTFPELFADRAHHYITVFTGGVIHRDLVELTDDELKMLILRETTGLFGLEKTPEILSLFRHARAIPQYTIGYGKVLEVLREASARYLPLRFAGNYVGGLSLPKTVSHAVGLLDAKMA